MDETEKPDSEITFNTDGAWTIKIRLNERGYHTDG